MNDPQEKLRLAVVVLDFNGQIADGPVVAAAILPVELSTDDRSSPSPWLNSRSGRRFRFSAAQRFEEIRIRRWRIRMRAGGFALS
ncbi:hypothetical protein [Microvirga sp. 2TAF3]|uniref:hypothetical protein n=1 Tax=Microvirga sp. 2TAF3 TaxID=3233014 RepID=UPI003F9C2704